MLEKNEQSEQNGAAAGVDGGFSAIRHGRLPLQLKDLSTVIDPPIAKQ